MSWSKPTEKTIEKLVPSMVEAVRENEKMPVLLAGILQKMRQEDPEVEDTALKTVNAAVAESRPMESGRSLLRSCWRSCSLSDLGGTLQGA